jgi:pimeloyl-ACP methyl ester carboxylesterase
VRLERLVTGTGTPVTVFAHGLASGISITRPLGSGVAGRKVFFQFRGHGRSDAPPGPWSYADLARDLRAVADLSQATRALGVSLGAGALCRILWESPGRFDRVVFFLPAVLDEPRPLAGRDRLSELLDAIAEGDAGAVAEAVSVELPPAVRDTPPGWAFLRQRVNQLMRDGLAPALSTLPEQAAVRDPSALGAVTAPALVIGCHGDDRHPAAVAERLAASLPDATLRIYDRPGVLWNNRVEVRDRIAGFLNDAQ